MNSRMTILATVAVLVCAALPVSAHHSFSAEFDRNKPVLLEGEVARMEFVNPHSWVFIDVTKEDGTVEQWAVEGGSPSVLFRRGWTRDTLQPGTKVVIRGSQAKDGSLRASGNLEFPDGTELELAGSEPPQN
jgi:DNA/RNA endonuclease YhcR with UshA esterase domain